MNPSRRAWRTCLEGVVWREALRFVHQRERFAAALVRPLIWLLVFAAGFRSVLGVSIVPPYDTYITYETYIVPGLVAMVQLFNGSDPSGGNGGGQREGMQQRREQMRQRIDSIFENQLTAEQYRQYEQLQRQAASARPGTIWIQSEDGDIAPVNVRFGISDDSHTQLISRGLQEGQLAVTRIREAR